MTDPRPALPAELPRAFELLFSHLAPAERAYRVAKAQELVGRGQLDARGVLVAPGASEPAGVFVCQPVPGAGGLVWPPCVVGGHEATEDRLVGLGCAWLRE